MSVLIIACQGNPEQNLASQPSVTETENCRMVDHMAGQTCVPANPERVIATDEIALEVVLALGLKPIAAAEPNMVSSRSRHLAGKVDDVVSLGKQNQLSLERILQLNPDFILGFAQMYNYEQFSQIAPTVAISYNDHDAWKASLQRVGEMLNRSQQARQQLENYQDRVEKLRRAIGDRLEKTEVSVVRFYADGRLEFRDSSSFPGSVLKDVGLPRPAVQYEGNSGFTQSVSAERLDLLDGDVMFVALDAGAQEAFARFQKDPLWQKLEAVQNNQVFTVDSGYWIFGNVLAANAILDDLFKYLVEERESA
jgi:iron complex transport system substrate-binding protein